MPRDEGFFKTISACKRCRLRKSRCDTGLPACTPCRNAGSECLYLDPRTKQMIPREHIRDLETQLDQLEALAAENGLSTASPDVQFTNAEQPDALPLQVIQQQKSPMHNSDLQSNKYLKSRVSEPQFQGNSSGIYLARSILETARQRNSNIDIEPSQFMNSNDSQTPGSQSNQPVVSYIAPTAWLSYSTAQDLVQVFFSTCQVQYPILSQESFERDIQSLYHSPRDLSLERQTKLKFCLHMAVATALLSRDNVDALTLAESYYESAMQDLLIVMENKDLATIQCLLLISVYSLLNSTRAPMWYLSGLSMRMCVDLGLHSEDLIRDFSDGAHKPSEDTEEKRRLFWVAYTLDRVLSITLGRPLSMRDGAIDVQLPKETEDDLRGKQMIHWIQLQRIQSEIVSRLYHVRKNNDQQASESDQLSKWLETMITKLDEWREQSNYCADLERHTSDWWTYWYLNAILLLLRPSLSDSSSDPTFAQTCYTSTITIIQISFIQQNIHTLDMTWTVVHHQFMAGITLLFAIWNCAEVRSRAITEWTTVKSCLIQCGLVLQGMTKRWQSAKGAREILQRLAQITIEVLEKEMRSPQVSNSASRNPALSSILAEQSDSGNYSNLTSPGIDDGIRNVGQILSVPQPTIMNDSLSFPPTFGEDLTRNLYADPAALYGFEYLGSNFFEDIDWSHTESPLNFHGSSMGWNFEG